MLTIIMLKPRIEMRALGLVIDVAQAIVRAAMATASSPKGIASAAKGIASAAKGIVIAGLTRNPPPQTMDPGSSPG